MKKYFDILGLPEDASQEAIQQAYDRLSKEPDPVNSNNQEFFVEEFEKLQEAYKVLSNSTILKSSEKSYINLNVEETPQVEQKKANNDSITITISPEKIEELKRNAKQNNNGSPNEKFFAKKNSLSIFYFIIFLFVNIILYKNIRILQIIENLFVLIFFTLFFELIIFLWKKFYKKNKTVIFYKGLNDFIETSFVYYIIWLGFIALFYFMDSI